MLIATAKVINWYNFYDFVLFIIRTIKNRIVVFEMCSFTQKKMYLYNYHITFLFCLNVSFYTLKKHNKLFFFQKMWHEKKREWTFCFSWKTSTHMIITQHWNGNWFKGNLTRYLQFNNFPYSFCNQANKMWVKYAMIFIVWYLKWIFHHKCSSRDRKKEKKM